jgi:hypothetical protein
LDGNEIKENVTEKDFIFMLKLLLTNNLGDRQIFINNYINQKIDNCTPINYTSNIMYGGYTFSDAQIETVNGLSESELEKIGKIVKSALLKRTKKYIIKQDLFTAILNWDSDYFVELAFVKTYSEEKEIMRSYFLEMCDFENEEEIITYFNLNDYLNKHTDLKIEITNKCLDSLRKSKEIQNKLEEKFEAEINAIDINDYKNKILTSKEAKSIKGRTLIYQSKNKYFVAISSAICGTISPCENLSKAIEYARTNSHKKAPIFISENRGRTYKLLDV